LAVLGRLLIGSGERLDLADLLSVDSYVAADFKYLIQSFIGADKPYILHGLDVINPQDSLGFNSISLRIAESVVYYPGAQAGAFYYGLKEGHINAQPLVPELRQNATNFVYLTLGTLDTARDSRAFWDPDQNGGAGGEFSQDVNTQTALKIEVNVSTSTFPENTIPICKVVIGTVISSIEDCRDHFFRLGTGGISPDPFSTYNFRKDPSASYARLEPPGKMTTALNPNPFQGGDKNIRTLKEWMDVVMTRIKELGGTTYWYQGSATPGSGPSINNAFLDALGSTIKSKGEWQHSGVTPGEATWTEDLHYYSLIDSRDLIVRADTVTLTSSDMVAWINLSREANFNNVSAPVAWDSGTNYLSGVSGSFINISKGDWVKKSSDPNSYFRRIEELSVDSLGASPTTAALALYAVLSDVYPGITGTDVGQYTKGEYQTADINLTTRDDAAIATAGGNFFWLAYRSDTSLGLTSAVSTTLSLNITDTDGVTAKCTTGAAHGLLDKDRITIATGPYAGTYVVEYESATVFNINTAVTGDDLGRAAYYGIITTAARSTTFGYALETAQHGFKSGEQITVAGASPWDGSYTVNYRSTTSVQVAVASPLATTGPTLGEIVNLARLNVRTEFGTVKVVQGESANIGDMDSANLLSYIGMDSLAQTTPNYSIPGSYNALNGAQNYNSLATDNLTTRVSKLTAMMADRVQDRGTQIVGRTNIVNATNGINQDVSTLTNLTLKKPSSPDQTINLTSVISLPADSVAVIDIDRDGSATLVPTIESWGNNYLIAENKIILFYRFADTTVYTWQGEAIAASGHLNTNYPDDSQNRNVFVFNPGRVEFDPIVGLLYLDLKDGVESTDITVLAGGLVIPGSYFTFNNVDNLTKYYAWYQVNGSGTDPAPFGRVGILVSVLSTDTATVVAAQTVTALNTAAGAYVTATNIGAIVTLVQDFVGYTENAANGTPSTTFIISITQQGFDPDISIVIPGSSNNTIDVDAINALGTLILTDQQSAWVRINRFATKTFNQILTTDTPDTDVSGAIYITNTSVVPIDQDVFVLWSRVLDNIAETNKSQRPDGNVYDESYTIVPGLPVGNYELQGPILAGTVILLPPDSRGTISSVQEYVVGAGQLEMYLDGQYLRTGVDWGEVGVSGALSKRITVAQDLQVGDTLTFRTDASGAVYFASDSTGNGTLQDAYDNGRFISVVTGLPVTVAGTPGTKLLWIQGDIQVDGVIDPAGITFTQQVSDPLAVTDWGIWRNASDQFIFKQGAGSAINLNTDFVRRDGSLSMSANLNLNSNKIINLATPTLATDASTKGYVDTVAGGYLKLDGTNAMTANLNAGTNRVINVVDPTGAQDAATKAYADLKVAKAGDTMSGNLAMGANKITGLANGTLANDAVNYAQLTAFATGALWLDPILDPNLIDDSLNAPPGLPVDGDVYIVGATPSGAWIGYAGYALFWNGSSWIDLLGRPVATDDRFGVSVESLTIGAGGLAGQDEKIAQIVSATPGFITYTFTTPTTPHAVYVGQLGSPHFGHSYTYNGSYWVEFSGPSATNAGIGLSWNGNTLNVNLGAGIVALPADEVGVDVHTAGGLFTTVDNSISSTVSAAQLAVKLDGSTLSKSSSGLRVATGGITNTEVATGIDAIKVANGSVSNTEFQYLDGVTSSIQTQIDNLSISSSAVNGGAEYLVDTTLMSYTVATGKVHTHLGMHVLTGHTLTVANGAKLFTCDDIIDGTVVVNPGGFWRVLL